ncbi:polysaccharide biosynthesis tyrosine autokinase [Demequina sp. SO4-18]|uniref:polysaccharide biosynthesis tyrosine autokinase n=1 Tax=Demequina sp. SO4-18 TaxID=3401026 RepID=UPI003B59C810
MELQDYLLILRKNWWLILLATMVGATAAVAYSVTATPSYTASAKVFVSTSGGDSVSELQQGNTFTQQRVTTYAQLVKTAAVLQPTIEALGIDTSVVSLREAVSASAPLNTTVLDITVTNADPVFAASLATTTANALIDVVEDIETTEANTESPVSLSIVQEAEVPFEPTSPRLPLNVALGLLLGLAIGMGTALLRHALDTRVRGEREVELITEKPVIGGIVFDPKAKERPLVLHSDPRSPLAESFRTLRTNLQFLDAGKRHRSFVVTSSLPGEGKSTTAANLAIALSDAGARVLLVGADLRRPKTAQYMGIEGGVGLTDVLVGRAPLADATQQWGRTSLYLLPAGTIPPNPSELLGSTTMADLIERLRGEYDVVLYDSPPLLPVTDAAVLARLVGGSLLVVATGRTRRPQLEAAVDALENVEAPVSGVVLTMLQTKGADAYGYGRYGYTYEEPSAKKK